MAKELFTEAGDKVEVKTDEEIEEEKRQAIEKERAVWESTAVKERDEKISTLESELEKLKEKELNFSQLREKTKTQEDEHEKNQQKISELETKVESTRSELKNFVTSDFREELVDEVAMGDADVKKAIQANYSRISGPEDTKEQIITKVKEAAAIVAANSGLHGQEIVDFTAVLSSAGSSGRSVSASSKGEMSPELQEMAKKQFGISDKVLEQVKKYKENN